VIFRRTRSESGMHSRGKEAPPIGSRRWLRRSLLLGALALALHATWIPAKAALAQQLLASSWQQSKHDNTPHRPWPWADTHPVARIEQPRLGISQVVLAGDAGRPLAFGPGWAESSARPGSATGTVVISGHRDTHFSWLRELRDGDIVRLEHAGGERVYRVVGIQVADSRTHRLATSGDDTLVLVTCWPFDATAPRGPMRYLVTLAPTQAEPSATEERGEDQTAAGRRTTPSSSA
jgi:sortase A